MVSDLYCKRIIKEILTSNLNKKGIMAFEVHKKKSLPLQKKLISMFIFYFF